MCSRVLKLVQALAVLPKPQLVELALPTGSFEQLGWLGSKHLKTFKRFTKKGIMFDMF